MRKYIIASLLAVAAVFVGAANAQATITNYTTDWVLDYCSDGNFAYYRGTFAVDSSNGKRKALNSEVHTTSNEYTSWLTSYGWPSGQSNGATHFVPATHDASDSTGGANQWASKVNVYVTADASFTSGCTNVVNIQAP